MVVEVNLRWPGTTLLALYKPPVVAWPYLYDMFADNIDQTDLPVQSLRTLEADTLSKLLYYA